MVSSLAKGSLVESANATSYVGVVTDRVGGLIRRQSMRMVGGGRMVAFGIGVLFQAERPQAFPAPSDSRCLLSCRTACEALLLNLQNLRRLTEAVEGHFQRNRSPRSHV
eukprot:2306643-Amphidinium_carterae.1